jgi:transposase
MICAVRQAIGAVSTGGMEAVGDSRITGLPKTAFIVPIVSRSPPGSRGGISTSRCILKAMKALEIIDFSKHLMRHLPRPLLVICGRLPGHDSVDVRAFVAAQRGRLMLEWLPGYAPELNPVEHLWAHLQNHEDSEPLPRDLLGAERRGSRRTAADAPPPHARDGVLETGRAVLAVTMFCSTL